jgi:hypothetical protein
LGKKNKHNEREQIAHYNTHFAAPGSVSIGKCDHTWPPTQLCQHLNLKWLLLSEHAHSPISSYYIAQHMILSPSLSFSIHLQHQTKPYLTLPYLTIPYSSDHSNLIQVLIPIQLSGSMTTLHDHITCPTFVDFMRHRGNQFAL